MGGIINSYFRTKQRSSQDRGAVYKNGQFLRIGQINKIFYPDSEEPRKHKKYVSYKVSVLTETGMFPLQQPAIAVTDLGSTNDYSECILEASAFAFKGDLDTKNPPQFKNGTFVLVGFLDGNIDRPIILGAFPHPRRDWASLEDGIRYFSEYRGIQTSITKDGALSITYKSPRNPNSEFSAPDTAPTKIEIDQQGVFSIIDKENQVFKVDRTAKLISIEQLSGVQADDLGGEMINPGEAKESPEEEESQTINSIVLDKENQTITSTSGEDKAIHAIDGKNEAITMTFASGLVVTIDGQGDKVEITTAGGSKLTVDGSSDKIEAEDSVGGKLKISGGKVGLGGPSAELLDQVSQLLTALQAETHQGNLGYPTGTPINSGGYDAIKTLIDGIKGGI